MLPDRVSNPGPLTYKSDALPIALSARLFVNKLYCTQNSKNCGVLTISSAPELSFLCKRQTMICVPVWRDNLQALGSGLLTV